ncbi:stretch-activated cation channel Mid1 [Chiua virens]|nr:stretch-activated cation channel Mid1 [Chiua virens]
MSMLPIVLISFGVLVSAQHILPLNTLSSFSSPTSLLDLPVSSQLTVSVAICAPEASSARFFVSNSTSGVVPGPSGGPDVFEIQFNLGNGNWSGSVPSGGLLSVQDLNRGSFQILASDNGTTLDVLDQLPLLGDTTSNQAILFSHAFLPVPIAQPSYPNYTLPVANLSVPDIPTSIPNFTLVVAPTSAQLSSLPQTACALLNTSTSTGSIVSTDTWLRNSEGWRSQWLVADLELSTNYTAYVIQDSFKVSGPIYFTTKSDNFPCPLVHSLPYCPSTAYAVALPPLPAPTFGYDASSLPTTISSSLLQYMTNFTTMLSTFACGRDLYSPLQTCADCQSQYRTWLCSISFPRCSEPGPNNSSGTPPSLDSTAQVPISALQPQPSGSPSRNPFFPNASYDYMTLLPCLETCNAVDRACPYFLGIKCPTVKFNAAASYGVGFVDSGADGEVGNGTTGAAQDRWGNVWCNGS